ncbi:hypothetical protein ACFQZ4_39670 [Catellatospora coxensis]|uniref:Lipoprotein n=1 Tax=Catellatospora coxensis TaxID=310354 RepID=A0A8J3KZU6_9ACTN|nr:hypothetical protein [Catellatospora coxensis]GIG09223.1 hypothetical protein Cco03nite_59230 [Catellatospora coxensis]
MNSFRFTGRAFAALLIAAALTGCAGQEKAADEAAAPPPTLDGAGTPGCGLARPTPSPIETAGSTMWPTSASLDDVLGRIGVAGEGRFAEHFAGLEVVPEKGHAIVYRVPSADFDAFVTREAGNECVYLRDAAFGRATLQTLADRVINDSAYWRKQNIQINSTSAGNDGTGVTVGVLPADVARARAELPKRYGTAVPIIIEEQEPITPAW